MRGISLNEASGQNTMYKRKITELREIELGKGRIAERE